MENNKNNLKIFFIKLISIMIVIIGIINFSITFVLDRVPFISELSQMNKKQIRNSFSEKIRKELKSALDKEKIFHEEDKQLIYKLYIKVKDEFKNIENTK